MIISLSPFLLFVIVVVVVTALTAPRFIRVARRGREEAREIAEKLGLTFVGGFDAIRANYLETGKAKALEGLERMPAFLRSFVEASAPWRMEGMRSGVRVAVYKETRRSGKSSQTYVVAKAWYPEPLPFKFRAAREGALAKLGKALFGLKDVQIGDADFDPKVRIRSDDESGAAAVFFRDAAASAFLALLERFPEAVAGSAFVSRERQASLLPREELAELLDLLAAFAAEVRPAGR